MWIRKLRIENVKSFADSGEITFSKGINLLLAPNNAGKTTILRCIYALQLSEDDGINYPFRHRRIEGETQVLGELMDVDPILEEWLLSTIPQPTPDPGLGRKSATPKDAKTVTFRFSEGRCTFFNTAGARNSGGCYFPNNQPFNWIFPYFSNRKVLRFEQVINLGVSSLIAESSNNLYAKIDALCTGFKSNTFKEAVKNVLGIDISTKLSASGKEAGFFIDEAFFIPLENMGEGTRTMMRLLADLFSSSGGRLFLLEEPENDVHPAALKALLNLILDRSGSNQFIISTHSNIVVKHLGADPTTKLFSISLDANSPIPTSTIQEVPSTAEARIQALMDLGYDVFDFDLFKGYLLLEESSAERFINDLLIPYFAPSLAGRLRTVSSGGVTKVEQAFDDFLRLFVFVHLAPMYRGKAWVIVDGDEVGSAIVSKLREKFSRHWDATHFRTLQEDQFENYYPEQFKEKVTGLKILPKQEKRQAKEALLNEVLNWMRNDPEAAKTHFEKAAADLIEILRDIDSALNGSAGEKCPK